MGGPPRPPPGSVTGPHWSDPSRPSKIATRPSETITTSACGSSSKFATAGYPSAYAAAVQKSVPSCRYTCHPATTSSRPSRSMSAATLIPPVYVPLLPSRKPRPCCQIRRPFASSTNPPSTTSGRPSPSRSASVGPPPEVDGTESGSPTSVMLRHRSVPSGRNAITRRFCAIATTSGSPSPVRSPAAIRLRPFTRRSSSSAVQTASPLFPRTARSTPAVHPESHAIEETISGTPSPSRSTIAGVEIGCRQSGRTRAPVTAHSSIASKSPNTGVVAQVTGSNCGRHRPSVGSQNAPIGHSNESVQGSPGSVQTAETHTCSSAQQTVRSAPHRTALAHGGRHRSSTHSSPSAQHAGGVPHRSALGHDGPSSAASPSASTSAPTSPPPSPSGA
ncbi:MAG: hypothetical protein QME96_07045 [Myxococcota bacterium]|nr:hypothetical protein [Myxococcota bacterium]